MIVLWMSVFGGLGAAARFVSDGLIRTALGRNFPWATMIINVVGSFILGLFTGLVLHRYLGSDMKVVIGTGFCGGFTTFSTASFEAVRLIEERRFGAALGQIVGNCGLTFLAALAGLSLF